jgi:hypothetical protein
MATGTSTVQRIATAERRQFIVALRAAGATYQQCADQAAEHFGLDRLPKHWDSRYAYKDVQAVLDKMYKEMYMDIQGYQQIQVQRYESIIRTYWPKAMRGQKSDAEVVLKAMKDENKLLGLDSPQRVDIRVQQIDARIEKLMEELTSGAEREAPRQLGAGNGSQKDTVVEGTARHL